MIKLIIIQQIQLVLFVNLSAANQDIHFMINQFA